MFLLIDKPKGWTSHDIVAKIKKIINAKKVGHAGTLDPNATGLLIVATNEDTKKLGEIALGTRKTYEATIYLGEERTTDDIEGEVTKTASEKVPVPTEEKLREVLEKFKGEQLQIPPAYSAIKLKGQKAYDLARKGKEVKLEPRKITVYSIKVLEFNFPILKIEFEVSAGTYIRSLARDIGRDLKTFGYLKDLRRTKIGEFSINEAVTWEEIKSTQ